MVLPTKVLGCEYGKALAALVGAGLVVLSLAALFAPTAEAASTYQPPQLTNSAVQTATLAVALQYANVVPGLDAQTLRWFLYTIEHRESTFNTNLCNYNDGAGSWNQPISSFWPTTDHLPHGCGLTQLTGWTHEGMPYPGNSGSAPSNLNKGIYGTISVPAPVTLLSNPFDPSENLHRFVSEEVLPDFIGVKKTYPSFTTDQALRAVAFHWNKGEYTAYQASNCDYLCLYDTYAAVYKPAVLADHTWPPASGSPAPTPVPAPAPSPSGPSMASFVVGSGANANWIEVTVSSPAGTPSSVSASVNGGAPIALTLMSWGKWSAGASVPAGSSVVFKATLAGQTMTSPTFTWLRATPATPAPSPGPGASVSFSVSPNINAYWIEVTVSPAPTSVSASINGGAPVALKATSWGSWATSVPVPAGARVTFTAVVNGVSATSQPKLWP